MHDDRLDRIETKIDKILERAERVDERVGNIDVTIARQAEQLGEHMRRTTIAEENIGEVRRDLVDYRERIMGPLVKAHFMWNGVGKALALIATVAGIVEAGTVLLRHR